MPIDLLRLCTLDAMPALPQNWWAAWSLAPAVLLPLLALAVLAGGQGAVARFASPAFPALPGGAARRWRLAGLTLLALALVSPLCRLAATLASAHMVQLMVLVAGCALLALGWAPPRRTHPAALPLAAALHGGLLWLWHLPAVYAATLTSSLVHWAATAALAAASFAFFHQAVHAPAERRGAALLAVLATLAHTGLLGALLTFAGQPLYALQAPGARAWGLDPLTDQQLAGLVMWVPGGLSYMALALGLALHHGSAQGRRSRRGAGPAARGTREPAARTG
ncbi:cytochrome c oxidase assembly protein [Pseudacidovorax intermedius]|uniref:cytochrome c oxidase assembly protein n=1 Tax=Pseudacidovorax intermedius TaxID=433924 RepID=UPI000734BE3A|nr:cytochrome c oxidase assembly protein [Pseudacidovorax intermedius]